MFGVFNYPFSYAIFCWLNALTLTHRYWLSWVRCSDLGISFVTIMKRSRVAPLYDHNARPVTTRIFALSKAGAPQLSSSQVSVTAASASQHRPPAYYNEDPNEFEDSRVIELPIQRGELDVDEDALPFPETISPGINVRPIICAKRYENSVSFSPTYIVIIRQLNISISRMCR